MREKPAGLKVGILLALLMLFLVAPMAFMLMLSGDPVVLPKEDSPTAKVDESPVIPQKPGPASTTRVAASTVATRALASKPATEELAERPTACILVVDRDSKQPVAGAAVRRVQGGADLAFTDERGLASVPLKQAEQLAVIAAGYLLRMAPTQLGSTEAEPQRVLMVRDEWSIVRRFQFVGRDGRNAPEAFVRFRPRLETGPATSLPSTVDGVTARAWQEHAMLAGLPVCADVAVQLGKWSQDRVHRIAHLGEVRFAMPGEFLAEVATETGLVGQATLRLEAATAGQPSTTIRIDLERGDFAAGTVVGLGSMQPLAGAEVTLQGGEPLGLLATTGSDGSFRLGPLPSGQAMLNVRHGDHQPLAWGPIATNATNVKVLLQPLPKSTLRGRVRSRPDLQPIAGARLSWSPNGAAAVTATTGADGTFQLAATGETAARLAISAPGFVAYAELVQPGSPFAEYDLWPGTPEVRIAKGLSARLVGIVVDAQGRAVPGVSVRWIPAQRTEPAGMPGRRTLDGGTLELPLIVATGTDGAFLLETTQFGAGRVCLAEAGPSAAGGIETVAVAGTIKDGLRLQR